MLSENEKLLRVLAERCRLIDQLDRGIVTKQEFQAENYRILLRWQMKPYPVIRTMEQGIYNYQYYNTLAKEWQRRLQCARPGKREALSMAVRNYFSQKDECIRQMLLLTLHETVVSYFIVTESEGLRDRLLEIVYPEREKVIFHTLNPAIIQTVRRLGILQPGIRRSRIHTYINTQKEEVR